jgi:hypothetical protein
VSCSEQRHAADAGPGSQGEHRPTHGVAARTSPPASPSDPLTSDLLQSLSAEGRHLSKSTSTIRRANSLAAAVARAFVFGPRTVRLIFRRLPVIGSFGGPSTVSRQAPARNLLRPATNRHRTARTRQSGGLADRSRLASRPRVLVRVGAEGVEPPTSALRGRQVGRGQSAGKPWIHHPAAATSDVAPNDDDRRTRQIDQSRSRLGGGRHGVLERSLTLGPAAVGSHL